MTGNYEIGNTSYPIAYLEAGEDSSGGKLYRITDMRELTALSDIRLTRDAAVVVAHEINRGYRTGKYPTAASLQEAVRPVVEAKYPAQLIGG